MQRFARALVDADRASLFLVDANSCELYARIFDLGNEADQCDHFGKGETREIRLGQQYSHVLYGAKRCEISLLHV